MRFSQFASTLALFAVACATPGHPGAQPLRLTADNNFGARDDLMGNRWLIALRRCWQKGPRNVSFVFRSGVPRWFSQRQGNPWCALVCSR